MNLDRPFWSVMIPTYEPKRYLEQAIESVLAQNTGADEMQIEVVDDGSTEVDVERLVRNVAGDRVAFHRRSERGGVWGSRETLILRARGRWVYILHPDGLVLAGFYQRLRHGIGLGRGIWAGFLWD